MTDQPRAEVAVRIVELLTRRGESVVTAESLTGGLVCARLVDVPGASLVLRGGVVAYATDLKHRLLGVDAELLAREGAVHPMVAVAMAEGARARLTAVHAVATTGVAGPDPQDGHRPGTVHVAVAGPNGAVYSSLLLPGDRAAVRSGAAAAALALLLNRLERPDYTPEPIPPTA